MTNNEQTEFSPYPYIFHTFHEKKIRFKDAYTIPSSILPLKILDLKPCCFDETLIIPVNKNHFCGNEDIFAIIVFDVTFFFYPEVSASFYLHKYRPLVKAINGKKG